MGGCRVVWSRTYLEGLRRAQDLEAEQQREERAGSSQQGAAARRRGRRGTHLLFSPGSGVALVLVSYHRSIYLGSVCGGSAGAGAQSWVGGSRMGSGEASGKALEGVEEEEGNGGQRRREAAQGGGEQGLAQCTYCLCRAGCCSVPEAQKATAKLKAQECTTMRCARGQQLGRRKAKPAAGG